MTLKSARKWADEFGMRHIEVHADADAETLVAEIQRDALLHAARVAKAGDEAFDVEHALRELAAGKQPPEWVAVLIDAVVAAERMGT